MWYVACLIRGMKIDDAMNQLKFVHKKGAVAVLEALQEAQELAVKEHNVEFRSNLWVGKCTEVISNDKYWFFYRSVGVYNPLRADNN